MKKIIVAMAIIASFSVSAETVSGKITNTGNRGAHFDINGGMRQGGITSLYPPQAQTVLDGVKTIKSGYTITMEGSYTENGMFKPTSATVSQ